MTQDTEDPIAVLAGNQAQFVEYKMQHPELRLRYCGTYSDLIGWQFSDYVIVGTFWSRSDATYVHSLLKTRISRRAT